ncbi:hypothetical protein Ahy_B10g100909 [Arachis hypogaea]|uniref:Uncharacterized protein n=1 Tax=Arachis hypogaea TaxID=3818 RepID=A0A444WY40_ARAHY|nr:hypothetical protein Ahy_B10g100909 [Arachis hypogaea]
MCGYADLRIGSADITAKSAIRSDHSADPIRSDGSTDRIISAKFGSVADNYRRYADIIRSMCSPILDHLKGLNRHISTSVEAVSDDVKLRGNAYAGVVEQESRVTTKTVVKLGPFQEVYNMLNQNT